MVANSGKSLLRQQIVLARKLMTPEERASANAAIQRHLLAVLATLGVQTVAAYMPMPAEPGGSSLPAELAGVGVRVLLPVRHSATELNWAFYDPAAGLRRSGALWEPVGPLLGVAGITRAELVILPALAVDHSGVRLGRAGGYYDRVLHKVSASTVALIYDAEFVASLPVEPHDQPVSAVITPSAGWHQLRLALRN